MKVKNLTDKTVRGSFLPYDGVRPGKTVDVDKPLWDLMGNSDFLRLTGLAKGANHAEIGIIPDKPTSLDEGYSKYGVVDGKTGNYIIKPAGYPISNKPPALSIIPTKSEYDYIVRLPQVAEPEQTDDGIFNVVFGTYSYVFLERDTEEIDLRYILPGQIEDARYIVDIHDEDAIEIVREDKKDDDEFPIEKIKINTDSINFTVRVEGFIGGELKAGIVYFKVEDAPMLTFTFTEDVPSQVIMGSGYTGPLTNKAMYDAGDGKWEYYDGHPIEMKGDYFTLKGDWRDDTGTYSEIFKGVFMDTNPVSMSGSLEYSAHESYNGYKDMFRGCTGIEEILDNPIPEIGDTTGFNSFESTYMDCVLPEDLPEGFMDLSKVETMGEGTLNGTFKATQSDIPDREDSLRDLVLTLHKDVKIVLNPANTEASPERSGVEETFYSTFEGNELWTGNLLIGDTPIYEALPEPDAAIFTFQGCLAMEDYSTIPPNWKDGEENDPDPEP